MPKIELKVRFWTVVFAVIFIAFSASICAVETAFSSEIPKRQFCVVIDAGHGGMDGGAVGTRTKVTEKEINLLIANELAALFSVNDFRVVMTRTQDVGLYGDTSPGFKRRDLAARKKIIEEANADLVISIHLNTCGSAAREGAQVFFNGESVRSRAFGRCVQTALNKSEDCVRAANAISGDFYMVTCTPVPSVLVECGFLSSPVDEARLLTEKYRESLAYSIYCGSVFFLFEDEMRENPNELIQNH